MREVILLFEERGKMGNNGLQNKKRKCGLGEFRRAASRVPALTMP